MIGTFQFHRLVDNAKSYDHLDLSKSFAQLSLPECMEIIEGHPGWRVVAKSAIKPFTQFGPLQGEVIQENDMDDDFDIKDLWPVINCTKRRITTYVPYYSFIDTLFRYFAEFLQVTSAQAIRKSPTGSGTCVLHSRERKGMSCQSFEKERCILSSVGRLEKAKRFNSGQTILTSFGQKNMPKRQV